MNILAIDSCSMVATGAVLADGVLTAEFVINNEKTHSVKLLPQIDSMMQSIDMAFSQIDYFATTVGPGSFTGQRIGVATAKALAHAAGKPMAAVSALEAMAYNTFPCEGLICPIMDARREQVYTATYRWEQGALKTVTSDRAMALVDLLEELQGKQVLFLGDGVPAFREKIQQSLGNTASFAPPHLLHLRGGSVAMCALAEIQKGHVLNYSEVKPNYLRLSQAEREYNDRLRK